VTWAGDRVAKVFLREFPWQGMPVSIRKRFAERIRAGVKEGKSQFGVTGEVRVELVDEASGKLLKSVVIGDANG